MLAREKINLSDDIKTNKFNVHALNEVICHWPDGSADSMYIKELDVYITAPNNLSGVVVGWKDMREAFGDKDIIVDNFNTYFFEPTNEEDRKRGFTL